MVLAVAGVIAGVAGVNVIEVFFVRETLGASPTAYGLVSASWTAGMVAGSWVFARLIRRWADDGSLLRSMLALLGGCCLVVMVGAAAPSVAFIVPLWLAGGLMNGGEGVLSNVFMARRVPEAFRGRAFATLNAATQGAALVGYVLSGLLLERFAPRPLVAATGLLGVLVVVVVAVPVVRVIRRERAAALVTSAAVG
jgi:MFS family permease